MKKWISSFLVALVCAVFVIPGAGDLMAEDRAATLLNEVDKKISPASYETYFQIINQTPNGREQVITAYSAKKADGNAVVLIVAPQEMQGRAALRLGDDVWTHFPGETNLRKTTLSHSFIGGVFNNMDYLATSFSSDHTVQLLDENKHRFTLRLEPKSAAIPYRSLKMVVDKKSLTPVKLVQYAAPGVVIKTIDYDNSRLAKDGQTVLGVMNTTAEANRRYRSTIKIGKINRREFPKGAFTKKLLPKIGSIMR